MDYEAMWKDLKLRLLHDIHVIWILADDDVRLNGKLEGVKLAFQKMEEAEKIFAK
jgi:hypothetical protein